MKYEVLTDTLCDGWINCWTTTETVQPKSSDHPVYLEVPSTFDTVAEAQAEIDEVIEGMRESHAEANEDEPFDEEGERAQMVIVEVGKGYVDPATETLMCLLAGEPK